jgi:hypothetical protein
MKGKLRKQEYGWAIEYMAYDEIYGSSQEIYPITKDQSERIYDELVDLDKFYDFEVNSAEGAILKDFHLVPNQWKISVTFSIPTLGVAVPVKVSAEMTDIDPYKIPQVIGELMERYKEKNQEPINRYVKL